MLIAPGPATVRALPPPMMPVVLVRFSVLPLSAPIVALLASVIAPDHVLLPETFSKAPALLTPVLLRLKALAL